MTAAVIAALIAVLAAVGLLFGSENDSDEDAPPLSIAPIARRVERIRQLKFDHLPRVRRVTGAQARAYGLRELDRQATPDEVAAEQRLLKLVGLLPEDASLRSLLGKALSTEVAGFYDPATGTMSVVGDGPSGPLDELTLAHELAHALEDQAFGLDVGGWTGFGRDRSVAYGARDEGSATIAMVDYVVSKETGSARSGSACARRAAVSSCSKGTSASSTPSSCCWRPTPARAPRPPRRAGVVAATPSGAGATATESRSAGRGTAARDVKEFARALRSAARRLRSATVHGSNEGVELRLGAQ